MNTALQAQGTSQGRIIEVLASANGRPEDIAQNFNSEIKATILEPNGDAFRVNLGGLKQLLGNTAELSVAKLDQTPLLSSSLRPKIDELLESRSGDLESWINRNPIPVDFFLEAKRRKRDTALEIAPRDLIGDLVDTLLTPLIQSIGDFLGSVLGTVVNAIVTPIVSLINGLVNTLLQPILSPISSLIAAIGSVLSPIVESINSLLGGILTPINGAIKSALEGVLTQLENTLGQAILSPIINLLNQLIDAILPCGTSCISL